MIRRSTAIATGAILISLLVHFLGLSFASRVQPERSVDTATTDVVAMGNTFEDLAEKRPEPVVPDKTPAPKPPKETVPEPELAETPTSEVLVASANPKRTASPDTGSARVVRSDTKGPSEPAEGQVPKPETVKPSGGNEGTTADVSTAPKVETQTATEAPKGSPDARVAPVEAVTAQAVPKPVVSPAPQRLAALPAPDTPALPVTPVPEQSAVPIIPLESETVVPETTETTVEPNPETAKTENESRGSDLAVASSPRPPISPYRPQADSKGLPDGSTEFSNLLNPPLIESPITAYQRGQTDITVRQNRGAQSGGLGFRNSRGPGNSDVTNYAGQVLVHLNRAPPVRLSARGSARILFEINPDGTLGRVDILDSTGSLEIERAAKLQVRNAAPFPRPPQGKSRRLSFVYWN